MNGLNHYSNRTHFSVSSLVAFARCPRKYFYSSGCRLGTEEHLALKFGESMHASLPLAFHGRYEESVSTFMTIWKDRDEKGDDKRNSTQAKKILLDFTVSHSQGRSIYKLLDPPAGKLQIEDSISPWEIPFALDIGLSVPLVGRIDGLCSHRDTGRFWGLEWKTTSEMSTRFFEGFTFNPQIIAYTLALRSYGIPAEGVMVEAIPVQKTSTSSACQPVFVSDSMIDDFVKWAQWIGGQILECEKLGAFPKDPSACTPYSQFGSPGYQCEYLKLCLVNDWTQLKDMYVKRDDRPFRLAGSGDGTPRIETTTPTTSLPQVSLRPTDPTLPERDNSNPLRLDHPPSQASRTIRIGHQSSARP